MNYISAIRLKNKLSDALDLRLNDNAILGSFDQVILNPAEVYYQITDSNIDIVFNGNYKVYVANLCGENILEITSKVFIEEQTDSQGIKQIGFEIVNINQDFYFDNVILKFENTLNNQFWYSNPVLITAEIQGTRFEYTSVNELFGIDYDKFNAKMQSIRLNCRFNTLSNEITGSEYTNEIGNKVSSLSIITDNESYIFDKLDNYTYRVLSRILNHPIKYINGYRATNSVLPKDIEIYGRSNFGASDFKVSMNYNEKYNTILQVAEPLQLLSITPFGSYTLASVPSEIVLTFNHDIYIEYGNLILSSGLSGDLITFTNGIITNNIVTFDVSGLILENATYYINISSGFISSYFGSFEGGFFDFNVSEAEYEEDDYEGIDYFTN